jgi:hypothetical protein
MSSEHPNFPGIKSLHKTLRQQYTEPYLENIPKSGLSSLSAAVFGEGWVPMFGKMVGRTVLSEPPHGVSGSHRRSASYGRQAVGDVALP